MSRSSIEEVIIKKFVAAAALAATVIPFAAGCGSDADVASDNLSKAAEQFEIVRRIVAVNGITDKVLFEITGRCSLEYGESMPKTLDVICKNADGTLSKHYAGMSDNVTFISTQVEGANVSTTRTRVILKPERIIPDFDLVTSGG